MPRGPSKAAQSAEKYFKLHPDTEAAALAKRFRVDVSTIYRAAWYKARKKQVQA